MPQDQLFETALSLPQSERADLAFQLLQSLEPPGETVGPEEFGEELHRRIMSCRSGQTEGYSLDESRAIIRQRLSEGQAQ